MNKINPFLLYFIRFILGFVFIIASYDKIIDPLQFSRDIANYHIVPFGLENSIAIILPWLELFLGLGLILGIFIDGSSIISGCLLILFNLLVIQAILRGFNIECGCGLKDGEMVGWSKVIENLFLVGASYLTFKSKKRIVEIYPKSPLQ